MDSLVIVEDNIGTLEVLSKKISWHTLDIEITGTFTNGADALDFCRTNPPSAVLTDVEMPELNGIEFVSRLKEIDADVAVVFISAYENFDYIHHALRLEAFDYVLKPLDYRKVREVIASALERRRTRLQTSDRYFTIEGLSELANLFNGRDIDPFSKRLRDLKSKLLLMNFSRDEAVSRVLHIADFLKKQLQLNIDLTTFQELLNNQESGGTVIEEGFIRLENNLMKIWESRLKREERFVHQVQCIVRKNLFSPELSLQFIGNLLGYTPAYTGSCYKQITGTKLMDYIHKQRIEAAIDLIRQGNRTIGEISREVGFVNEAYFSTVFKKHTGASPSSFRDR